MHPCLSISYTFSLRVSSRSFLYNSPAPPEPLCTEEHIHPPLQLSLSRALWFCAKEAGCTGQSAPGASGRTNTQRTQCRKAGCVKKYQKVFCQMLLSMQKPEALG